MDNLHVFCSISNPYTSLYSMCEMCYRERNSGVTGKTKAVKNSRFLVELQNLQMGLNLSQEPVNAPGNLEEKESILVILSVIHLFKGKPSWASKSFSS